eukprot:Skav218348  [mRNA]  locus=scaffold755:1164637:1166322:- [translate_table: standard]
MPSISHLFLGIAALYASLAVASDSGAAPRLRGVPTVKGDEAEDVTSASPANPLDAAEATEPTAGEHGREVPEYVPPEDETLGTCCYRGSSGSEDMCSACGDVATDSTCSKKSRCAGCGGTWCPGPRCVKSFKDKTKPCQSADPFHGIAKSDDFCSLNEKQCSNCKGAWCPIANITYSDGTKYDPSHPYVPDSDQRQEAEDPEEAAEAEEEVANDPGLDDLFPDGLAEPELP